MNIPFLDLFAQYQSIRPEIDTAIARVIRNSSYIGGEEVKGFEKEFAAWLGIEHCVGCANGTDSMEILLEAMGVGPGDEVIVPAMTWIATSEAPTRVGATPIFADILPKYYTIDPEDVVRKITKRTKAIIPVHLYGLPAEMMELMEIAKAHNLKIIEDCAPAHGATYRKKKVGTLGHAASFSFYPGKNLGAYGDAGAMVTNDQELASRVKMIASHGQLKKKHEHLLEGRNSRLDGIQAAVLRTKLSHLNDWIVKRREIANYYNKHLSSTDLILPQTPSYSMHAYHLYVVKSDQRDELLKAMNDQGVQTAIHYPKALPFIEIYQKRFSHIPKDFPVAHELQSKILSFPIGEHIKFEQILKISI